jgi:hypothetical protein
MSKKLFFFFPALLLGAFLTVTSIGCGETDPCKDFKDKCGNGACFEGECVCDVNYEGTNCELQWADKFVGSYLGSDKITASTATPGDVGTTFNLTSPAVITKKAADKISIANFGGFNSFVEATITKSAAADITANKITINFTDPAGRKFVGDGTYSNGTIRGTYRATYSDGTYDDATFEYKK